MVLHRFLSYVYKDRDMFRARFTKLFTRIVYSDRVRHWSGQGHIDICFIMCICTGKDCHLFFEEKMDIWALKDLYTMPGKMRICLSKVIWNSASWYWYYYWHERLALQCSDQKVDGTAQKPRVHPFPDPGSYFGSWGHQRRKDWIKKTSKAGIDMP